MGHDLKIAAQDLSLQFAHEPHDHQRRVGLDMRRRWRSRASHRPDFGAEAAS